MTRPSDIKPREDSVPGTPFAGFKVGAKLDELRFTITPEIVEEYFASVEADPKLYQIDGRQAAPPNVLLPYMTCALYRNYPPIQGIVMAEVDMRFHHPIWANESTEIVVNGEIVDKFEKKGRRYVRWKANYKRADGQPIAELVNQFNVPE